VCVCVCVYMCVCMRVKMASQDVLLPAFEQSTRAMFTQINNALKRSLFNYILSPNATIIIIIIIITVK